MNHAVATAPKRAGRCWSAVAAVITLLILIAPHTVAAAGRNVTVVYPTGIFPDDVQNVQAAVDKGGMVFLRAMNSAGVPTAFDFGTAGTHVGQSGFVTFSTHVEIVGEREASYGTTIVDSFAADCEITRNTIRNVNSVNTEQGGGITVIRSQRSVLISHNLITPGFSNKSGVAGIFIDGDNSAAYRVVHNRVIMNGPFGDAIDVAGGNPTGTTGTVGAEISDNHLTLQNASVGAGGIVLFDLVSDSLVEHNRIDGDGYIAFGITTYGFETGIASRNRFLDNEIDEFSASFADVFFDANAQGNLASGECKSVIDLGQGNVATCHEDKSDSIEAKRSSDR